MTEYVVGIGAALWVGILTSISPCPLATNIAAISYIGRRVGNSKQVFLTGFSTRWDAPSHISGWRSSW